MVIPLLIFGETTVDVPNAIFAWIVGAAMSGIGWVVTWRGRKADRGKAASSLREQQQHNQEVERQLDRQQKAYTHQISELQDLKDAAEQAAISQAQAESELKLNREALLQLAEKIERTGVGRVRYDDQGRPMSVEIDGQRIEIPHRVAIRGSATPP